MNINTLFTINLDLKTGEFRVIGPEGLYVLGSKEADLRLFMLKEIGNLTDKQIDWLEYPPGSDV